jgi:hypothetical protein
VRKEKHESEDEKHESNEGILPCFEFFQICFNWDAIIIVTTTSTHDNDEDNVYSAGTIDVAWKEAQRTIDTLNLRRRFINYPMHRDSLCFHRVSCLCLCLLFGVRA